MEWKRLRNYGQKMFLDTFIALLNLSLEQMIENIAFFLKYWAAAEGVLERRKSASKLIKIPLSGKTCLAGKAGMINSYINKELVEVGDR